MHTVQSSTEDQGRGVLEASTQGSEESVGKTKGKDDGHEKGTVQRLRKKCKSCRGRNDIGGKLFSFTHTFFWHMHAHIHCRACLHHTCTHTRSNTSVLTGVCSSFPLADNFLNVHFFSSTVQPVIEVLVDAGRGNMVTRKNIGGKWNKFLIYYFIPLHVFPNPNQKIPAARCLERPHF